MNGNNDNPTATQFISAYRKLLHQSDILISNFSNVTSQCSSNVLTVSSVTKRKNLIHKQPTSGGEKEEEEWIEVLELQALENCGYLMDEKDTGISYVAHMLEQRLLNGTFARMATFARMFWKRTKKLVIICVSTPSEGNPA